MQQRVENADRQLSVIKRIIQRKKENNSFNQRELSSRYKSEPSRNIESEEFNKLNNHKLTDGRISATDGVK